MMKIWTEWQDDVFVVYSEHEGKFRNCSYADVPQDDLDEIFDLINISLIIIKDSFDVQAKKHQALQDLDYATDILIDKEV